MNTTWQRLSAGCWIATLPGSLVVTIQRDRSGRWIAKCPTATVGTITATGRTRADALRRLQDDYWFPTQPHKGD